MADSCRCTWDGLKQAKKHIVRGGAAEPCSQEPVTGERPRDLRAQRNACLMHPNLRDDATGRAFIRQGSSGPAHKRGSGVPRRGNPGDYQGSAGMRRRLCGRLSGRTGFALDRRSLRRRGNPGRARGALRGQRQRGCGRRHAGRLRQLSDPGRGHLQGARRSECRSRCARQPLLRRGDGGGGRW